jgi:hypothetical protein
VAEDRRALYHSFVSEKTQKTSPITEDINI